MVTALNEITIQILQQEGLPTSQLQAHPLPGGTSFYTLPVSRTVALATWQRLRQTGLWPQLMEPNDERIEWITLEQDENRTAESVIAAAMAIEPLAWIAQEREENRAWLIEHGYSLDEEEREEGTWPEGVKPDESFYTPQRAPSLWLCLVPTTMAWAVPAYRPFGGWNACPHDEVHVAFLRRWYEQYGAESVVMTRDILEFAVSRPPQTREEAITLAYEQYGYCADIVDQGTETISNLAATLLNSKVWYFWWD
jgi:hypothetical protein